MFALTCLGLFRSKFCDKASVVCGPSSHQNPRCHEMSQGAPALCSHSAFDQQPSWPGWATDLASLGLCHIMPPFLGHAAC